MRAVERLHEPRQIVRPREQARREHVGEDGEAAEDCFESLKV
jgi:hypothetical protein